MDTARSRVATIRNAASLAALLMVLLTGCGLPWALPQPTPDLKLPDAQQVFRPQEISDELRYQDPALENLDPALIHFPSDYHNAQLLFPGLVTLDEHQRPMDWASARHEVSADGLTYTFHLHKGMTWSDGTPIDASTFAYSINRALDPCIASGVASYLSNITGAQSFSGGVCPVGAFHSATTLIGSSLLVPDPLTLHILVQRPAGSFLAALTYPLSWAVPPWLVERYTQPATVPDEKEIGFPPRTTSTWTEHLTDNGGFGGNLYRLTRWDHVGHLDFERNERFWGQKPLLRRIEYTLFTTLEYAWEDFAAGKGDVSKVPFVDASGKSGAAVARALKGVTLQQTPVLETAHLTPDWQSAPFDDMRVRQAISLAIDRQALAREAFESNVIPSVHLVPDGMPGYNPDLADVAGRTGQDALTPDVAKARALATAYAAEKCGGAFSGCPPLVVFGRIPAEGGQRVDAMLEETWQAAFPGWRSIFCTVDGMCHPISLPTLKLGLLTAGGQFVDYPDPQNILSLAWTTQAPYHRSSASIPAVDTLCAQADASTDQDARLKLYQQAEQLLVTQVAAIPLYQNSATYAVRSRVVGWRIAPSGMTPLSVWQQTYIKR